MVQLIALLYKDQHVTTLHKLLNLWLEASISESSEDNESNTSPPDRGKFIRFSARQGLPPSSASFEIANGLPQVRWLKATGARNWPAVFKSVPKSDRPPSFRDEPGFGLRRSPYSRGG